MTRVAWRMLTQHPTRAVATFVALFYGAHARHLKMLIGSRAQAKPCIVGQVEKPMGSIADGDDLVRKYRLETNEWANWRESGKTDPAWPVTGGEVDIALGDFRNT